MGWLAGLSVLTEVIETTWLKSNCRMHLLCCSFRYFGAVKTCRCENHAKSCPVSSIFHIIFHTKVPQYTQNAWLPSEHADDRSLSCLTVLFVLVSIAVIKVNLPATRALVRTRTTTEKNIFPGQRIHKPRQLHSTYTSNYTGNRARLHSPPEPLHTLTPLLFLLFSL